MAGTGILNWGSNLITWDPGKKGPNITLSGGNLSVTTTSGSGMVLGTVGKISGQWYWENTVTAGGASGFDVGAGNIMSNLGGFVGDTVNSWGYVVFGAVGFKNNGGGLFAYGASYTVGDIIAVALDMNLNQLTMFKNNVSQGVMFTGLVGVVYPAIGNYSAFATGYTTNFGATPFTFTPPAGFIALTP